MANGLLQQIAAGPDILGAIAQGQHIRQNRNLLRTQKNEEQVRAEFQSDLARGMPRQQAIAKAAAASPKVGAELNKVFSDVDQSAMTTAAMDITAAFALDGEPQTKFLKAAENKSDGAIKQMFSSIVGMPAGEERNKELFRGMEAFQRLGALTPLKKDLLNRGKQKTGAFLVTDPVTGEKSIATGVFDTQLGTLTTETASFGGLDVVSKLGETAGEQTTRRVDEKRAITRATTEEERAADLIKRGVAAAESTGQLRRGLELMEKVKTGGINSISFAVKRNLGIEGADEGELSQSLGKAVLSQLKETFGAQFTVQEVERLERLESGFGKSVASNIRILKQTLKFTENLANRGRRAAKRRKDTEAVKDIDGLLKFTLSTEAGPQEGQVFKKPQTGERIVLRNGKWEKL